MIMPMRLFSTSWRWRILGLLVLGAGGCGLSEYEARMDKQRERVAKFDELNRLLDAPIEMPVVQTAVAKDKVEARPAWPFDLFLRLPRGYGTSMKDKNPHNKLFPMVRYAGGDVGMNVLVVAALVQEPKTPDNPAKHLYEPRSFRAQLRLALAEFCSRTSKIELSFSEKSRYQTHDVAVLTPYPETAPTIRYEFGQHAVPRITVPCTFEVYLREEAGKQVAIIFQRATQLPAVNADAFNKSVAACLGTLDISAEAAGRRGAFKKQ